MPKRRRRSKGRWRRKRKRPIAVRLGRAVALAAVVAILTTVAAVVPWRWIDPPTSAFILRDRAAQDEVGRIQWTGLETLPPHVPLAFVAGEDQLFPSHAGFDVAAIRKVVEEGGTRPRGASTISQQVAKNLYLWPGRSFLRKGVEAYLTAWIELLWPKRRILEVYLNIAEFGPGVYGIRAASWGNFSCAPSELTARQSALLTAVLPNPKERSASAPSQSVADRARWIEEQMAQLGSGYLSNL